MAAWGQVLLAMLVVAGPAPAGAVGGEGVAALVGDAARGRAIVASRQQGLCLLCHSGPFPEARFQGNLAPDLAGAGSRLTAAQLRRKLAEGSPESLMPAYFRSEGLEQVGSAWRGRTIFSAQQLEDVVAYLETLK